MCVTDFQPFVQVGPRSSEYQMEKRERPELQVMEQKVKEEKEEEVEAIAEKGKYQRAEKKTEEEQADVLELKIGKAKVWKHDC